MSAAAEFRPVNDRPRSVDRLLSAHAAHDGDAVDAAWRSFVAEHSRLLLFIARSIWRDSDAAMDAYAFIIEQLQRDGFRRLRDYPLEPTSKFSTWLGVVARRLCLDLYRARYGRDRGSESEARRTARRHLQDLVAAEVDLDGLPDSQTDGADLALLRSELHTALEQALAALEPGDRLLLRLRFDDALSAREIAKLLCFPSAIHVYRRVNALLAELRCVLNRRGIESAVP